MSPKPAIQSATLAETTVPFVPPALGTEIAEVVERLGSGWLSSGARVAGAVGQGQEVVAAPVTFCAAANVVIHTGATPVFADIDPDTFYLDPLAAHAAITPCAHNLQPFYQERFGLRRGVFPAADAVSDSTLSLPLSAAMAPDASDRAIEALQ